MTQSLFRIEVGVHPRHNDPVGLRVAREVSEALSLPVDRARMVKVFTVSGAEPAEVEELVSKGALHDPVLQQASLAPVESDADWIIEVGFRPGVTDNEGRTARDTAALVLGRDRSSLKVYTSAQYHFWGSLSREQAERIAGGMLCNELIQRYRLKSREEWQAEPGFEAQAAAVSGSACDEVAVVPLSEMDDDALLDYSRSHTLALTLEEMKTIRDWFARPEVREDRRQYGLGIDPTDAEVEVLAQTWADHCKHKIFASRVTYDNKTAGTTEEIDNLYKTYIQKPTRRIRESRGAEDYCRSVFSDNAGVVA
ncbi:MAG: phosphoribosylformylglycinamidine synthase, partial [Mailhella sp.]|nr:phosphoribosylformylglycinamidine synthase [Mailhella sp.]